MRRWRSPLFLFVCALAAIGLLIYPLTVIQPFKYQEPGDLQHALEVFRIAPSLTLGLAVASMFFLIIVWRPLRRGPRIVCAALFVLICAAAFLTRINVFEQMFHPAGAPRFLSAKDARIEPDDMLIAVTVNRAAHAYPIREMGYHHVVNDFVGGVPIVATY